MHVLRVALWPVVLAAGGATAALILVRPATDTPSLTATLTLVIGLSWSITGLEEWRRRPENRIGPLMVLLGLAWYASQLQSVAYPPLYTVGLLLTAVYIVVFAHVLLAFPSGRLEGVLSKAIVVAGYLDVTLVVWALALFEDDPYNLAVVWADDTVADTLSRVAPGIGVVLTVTSLGVLAHRWYRATGPWRRVVAPVLWCGVAAAALGAVNLLVEAAAGETSTVAETVYLIAFAVVPFAFKLGLLRSRLARGAVAGLVVELGERRGPGKLRESLARTLHDPSLELAYWIPEQSRYVDSDGRPVELPVGDGDRVATVVEREGRRVAALVHDVSVLEDRDLVDAVSAAAGLALENERLQAELRARLEDLRASRARIVEATDAERKRIERNLHDGTQQRLVSVAMALGLAESKLSTDPEAAAQILGEARLSLGGALQELRELSQGIHPGLLTERGLGPALQELAYQAPLPVEVDVVLERRLPEPVEAAAYFVVAEGLANVVKYASASAVSVTVGRANGSTVIDVADDGIGGADPSHGSGLRGLADRVEALGGALAVVSPPGRGTQLHVEIPCES